MMGANSLAGTAGAGARPASELPMDYASRMARAKEMGFRNPLLYHGGGADFRAIDPCLGGSATGEAPARLGVWSGADPETANEFAEMAADRSGGNAQIYPLRYRTQRQGVIELNRDEENQEIAATLAQA
jgi:hypothetical protein